MGVTPLKNQLEMIYNYCTLFDSFFLSRGLTLYESLKKTTPNFNLYIFPFDKKADEVLRRMKLPEVIVVSQGEFETPQLLKIKSERTRGEYCWTCTPVIIDHCIRTFDLSHCTYLDADLFFLSSANQLIDEMADRSVLITDHRYTPKYDQSKTSGKYCVQFITFKNDALGMTALSWWKERCLEWCYDRFEDGKFGDQKYLDDWPTRFQGICDLENEGAGVAPWNIQQYNLVEHENRIFVKNKKTAIEWPIVFYHFHTLKFLKEGKIDLGAFKLDKQVIDIIYSPYILKVESQNRYLSKNHQVQYPAQNYSTKSGWPIWLHKIARRLLMVYNVFRVKTFVQNEIN